MKYLKYHLLGTQNIFMFYLISYDYFVKDYNIYKNPCKNGRCQWKDACVICNL